ncbi:beta-propeller domain-containing protein [Anaeromyxobacter oryzisoli]|uniref:beta-propeller domain-containing protein n=1 Tax=Anaeromyxobacter oryzisoli TaxID=2925408 RepID=UPI001F56C5A7|nr:beta-propeller domain-containing protein [Anaeromyxobacter sp. SG63]
MTFLRTLAVLTLASTVACNRSTSSRLPAPIGVDRSPSLTYAASCGELEGAIEDALVLEMKSRVEQLREGWGVAVPVVGGWANYAGAAGPESFTTTNAQVAGVDEADFVQNDGTRIAALADGRLHLVSSWPADAMTETASLAIEGWPRDLFLSGDQVVVFSTVYVPRALEGTQPICAEPLAGAGTAPGSMWCGYQASNVTKVTTVDVSALSAPRVTSEIYLPGSYLAARRIGTRVRLVMRDELPFPDGVALWPELSADASQADRDRAFDDLVTRNEALIRARTLDDWLRRGAVERPDGSTEELGYACGDFAIGSAPVHLGILTLATLDLDRQALAARTSVLARADVVYASKDTLYAAAGHWWWWPMPGQGDATYLHAFDLRDPDRAAYLGSGVVDGTLDDPYQLDELDGALRVASTLSTRVEDPTQPWGRIELSNQIAVLGLSGGALRTLGKTEPFGDGERLFGTRFVGSRGFAITARQIDPLFTFDLSDPAQPRKLGELTLPGFIAYLHPLDDTHLLGVGRELAASGAMQVKVQLLDVADPAAPSPLSTVLVGEGASWSESLWDPRAFTWFPARGLLAIPFTDLAADAFVSDLRLFKVDPAAGITPAGRLSMADVFATASGPGWSFAWSPSVRRSVLADDFVYAISDAGVRSAKVADLPAWLRTVQFAPP